MSVFDTLQKTQRIQARSCTDIDFIQLAGLGRPVVVEGAAADWPMVEAGRHSPDAAMAYLEQFYSGKPLVLYTLPPECEGTPNYDASMRAMNFEASRTSLGDFFNAMRSTIGQARSKGYYIQSTDAQIFFPGFERENGLAGSTGDLFRAAPPMVSLWLGGRTTARAHYDMSNNIAICLAGGRRFILFPPGQIHNLYPGPLALTPGGQVITTVDLRYPDFETHPRLKNALESAEVAELAPGDLLIYPALWWHQVEALADFNVLMNYWWNAVPNHVDTPWTTVLHALLSLRQRPASEKAAWMEVFKYYVFSEPELASDHLPEGARGPLGDLSPEGARRLRAELLNRLNR